MNKNFVSGLKNIQNFTGKFGALQQRGSAESCWMLADGLPGLGKTRSMHWFRQEGAILIHAKPDWTPPWMYKDILESLCVQGGKERAFTRVIKAIGNYQKKQRDEKKVAALVIDEADHMIDRTGLLLETLRVITDTTELPTILVSMDRLNHAVGRWPQIARRITQRAHYKPLDLEDVTALVNGLCEVAVMPDLIEHLAEKACVPGGGGAYVNEVVEGIGAIERFSKRHGSGPISRAEMKGVTLFNDRVLGHPIRVEGV